MFHCSIFDVRTISKLNTKHGAAIAMMTERPIWNSNIWFHLTDGAGWVSYAGVRAYQMTPDPDGLNPNGGPPVATSKYCEGAVQ